MIYTVLNMSIVWLLLYVTQALSTLSSHSGSQMHVCRIHGLISHQIIDLAHHVVPPLRSITKEMDDLFNQIVDHTTSFYILPYYLANTPPFTIMPSQ